MENENKLSWAEDGVAKRVFLYNTIGITIFMLIFLFLTLSVMFKASFIFGLIMSIFAICVLIFEGIVTLFYIVNKRLTFIEKMQFSSDTILLTTKEKSVELSTNRTKIYQIFNMGFGYFILPSGSYLKYDGRWYFIPVLSINHPIGKALSKLPGNRDYHIWIPVILFIIAAIAFLVYLVWFVIPSL